MEYRKLPGGEAVGTIGIGAAYLDELQSGEAMALFDYAEEQGVNLLDLAMAYPAPFEYLGDVLAGRRDKFLVQMHLGMAFPGGQYERTRDLARVKATFEEQLGKLRTDHADIGFIHCVDEKPDYDEVFSSGVFDYARRLKEEGRIRYLAFASHTVDICHRFVETGVFDVCMFSINAAYDLDPINNIPFEELDVTDQDILATSQSRLRLYRECEKRGIGIVVMKPFGGGILLDKGTSPFERAMTVPQCLQYALDRPAVLSCLLGVRSKAELENALGFYTASREERDYAFVAGLQHKEMRGTCVYCNHCLPCPSDIDIGAVNRYLDLYLAGDELAKEHYLSLGKRAKDCIECGTCEKNCPFHVDVRGRMRQAVAAME